jgi:hypothetical protein
VARRAGTRTAGQHFQADLPPLPLLPHAGGGGGGADDYRPVKLELRLPVGEVDEPRYPDHKKLFKQYGFNLRRSNMLPLDEPQNDIRTPECRNVVYPKLASMPRVSVLPHRQHLSLSLMRTLRM